MMDAARLTARVSTSILSLLTIIFGIMAYWALDTQLPVETIAAWVEPAKVRPGQPYDLHVTATRYRNCPATTLTTVWDADGRRVRADAGQQDGSGSWPTQVVYRHVMPSDAAPGPATHRFEAAYRCNPVQWIWPLRREHSVQIEVIR